MGVSEGLQSLFDLIVGERRRTFQLVNGLAKFRANWSNKNIRLLEKLSNLLTFLDNFFS